MNTFFAIIGSLLVVWAVVEALWTTVWVDGHSAPLTSRLTSGIWQLFRSLLKNRNDRSLSLAGPAVLLISVLGWVVLLWGGWTLLFYTGRYSLVASDGSVPDVSGVLWYVAYCMFTVGNGDFTPQGDFWQISSSLVSFSGMAMVTLSITYILQVISALTGKRAFSSQIMGIGKTPEEFVRKQWTGNGFGAIELQLNSLSQQLATLNEQHLAFPILHYYHAARPEKSMDVAVTILSESLMIIEQGVEDRYKPAETILAAARSSVDTFLTTMRSAFIKAAAKNPDLPDLQVLKEQGLPIVDEELFKERAKEESSRRKLLLGLINNGAWRWPSSN